MPGLANVDPAGYVRLFNAAPSAATGTPPAPSRTGINRLFEIAFVPQGRSGDAGGIGAFKAACAALGVITSATMPAPIEALSDDEVAGIEAIVREVGLI